MTNKLREAAQQALAALETAEHDYTVVCDESHNLYMTLTGSYEATGAAAEDLREALEAKPESVAVVPDGFDPIRSAYYEGFCDGVHSIDAQYDVDGMAESASWHLSESKRIAPPAPAREPLTDAQIDRIIAALDPCDGACQEISDFLAALKSAHHIHPAKP